MEDDHHASIRDHSRPNSNVNGISGCVAGGTLQTTAKRDRELGFDRGADPGLSDGVG